MFFRNPYYINKDPMKSIFFDGNDGSGRPMILRNPFAPGADTSKQQELRRLIESDGVVGPSVFYRW